jgi:hypothetical protein
MHDMRRAFEPHEAEQVPASAQPAPWREVIGTHVPPLTRTEAVALAEVCGHARLVDVALTVPFPTWLGYLGMILFELEPYPDLRLAVGRAWVSQFVDMGGSPGTWDRFKPGPLSWQGSRARRTGECRRLHLIGRRLEAETP